MNKQSTRDGFGKGLLKAGKNPNVVVVCADLTESTRVEWFAKKYPKRFVQVGVAEQNMMGIAAGLAKEGKIAFASSFAVFNPGRNWEQLRISVCYSNLNVKIQGCHAGITVGEDGATHQALEDIAMTRCMPNLIVIEPCDSSEAEKAVLAAVKIKGPVYIRCGREKIPVITDKKTPFKIGKANIMRKGKDISIIASGIMVNEALVAAEELAKQGVKATVVNCHTIKPIDKKTIIEVAKKTKKIITAEEHQVNGGLGSAVAEVLAENYPVPIKRIGVNDKFGESGTAEQLKKKYGLTSKEIIKAVHSMVKK